MDRRWAFLSSNLPRLMAPVISLRDDTRGARHWGASLRAETCMRSVCLDPDHDAVMRIGSKAPGGGPILSVGINAMSATGSRHLGSSISSRRSTTARTPKS